MADLDQLRRVPLFEGLTDDQLAELLDGSADVAVTAGETVFREGDHADSWWVLLEGVIDLSRHIGREDVVVGRMDVPGRWAGGFRAWDEQGVYLATGRASGDARVLRVGAGTLRELMRRWFPFATHLVAGVYGTARSIEATARQRSALVTLGTLAAGLAHEVNNPAAAATRSAADLGVACDRLLESLRDLAGAAVSAEQFATLDHLRRRLEPPTVLPDALALADLEDEVGEWLAARSVPDAWTLASTLVAAGADRDWCEQVLHALPADAVAPGLTWVGATLDVSALLAQVQESTRRVSELVGAVKTYTQMDRASAQRVDVRDGLESTLLVMGPRLRGVSVVRDWGDDVPPVDAMPGELNQVWTNLVDNAADALGGAGTLTVRTRREGEAVVVTVHDTGPGLDAVALERAFDAFWTTKDVGHGSGLGLDIARRIVVERHGGAIEVDSRPGDTSFRVRLPLIRA